MLVTLVVCVNLQIYTQVGGKKRMIVEGPMTDSYGEFLKQQNLPPAPRCPVLLHTLEQFHQNGSLHSFFPPFIQVLSVLCPKHNPSLNPPPAEHSELHTEPDHLPAPNGPSGKAVLEAISKAWWEGQHGLRWPGFSSVKLNLPWSPWVKTYALKPKQNHPALTLFLKIPQAWRLQAAP